MAGGGGERGGAAFKGRHALLEHRLGGVHDAGVDVAELLEAEKGCAWSASLKTKLVVW